MDFGKLEPIFDIMLVDAPCSGSGLFRRDTDAISHWSEQAVENCRLRQQRILTDALPSLLPGGYLIYATCSYSPAEDEAILDFLSGKFGMTGISLSWADGQNGVVATESPLHSVPCYRFYPDKVRGEGFFMALLQKPGDRYLEAEALRMPKTSKSNVIPFEVTGWLNHTEGMQWYRHETACYLMPDAIFRMFTAFQKQLHIRKAGIRIAEEIHGRYQPGHDFALCDLMKADQFPQIQLETNDALTYLRKENFVLPDSTPKGQILVSHNNLPLGWLKNLGNRFNNYYPKEWRIKMQTNG
jgi:NOL1/NOP2/fmu family ribosome biogenesis protein